MGGQGGAAEPAIARSHPAMLTILPDAGRSTSPAAAALDDASIGLSAETARPSAPLAGAPGLAARLVADCSR